MLKTLTEKYLRLDIRYFAENGLWLSIGQIISLGTSFLLALVISRTVKPEIYGMYTYLSSLTNLLGVFCLSGLGLAVTVATSNNYLGTLKRIFPVSLKWSLAATAAGLVLTGYSFLRNNLLFATVFLIYSVATPLINAAGLYDSFLIGLKRFNLSTKWFIYVTVGQFLFLLAAAFFFPNFFPLALGGVFIIQAVARLIFYRSSLNLIPKDAKTDPEALHFGQHVSVINVLATVADQIDSIVAFLFFGPANLALYAFALAFPEAIKGFFKLISSLAIPKLANRDVREIRQNLPRQMALILVGTIVVTILYIFLAPWLFLIFLPRYQSAVPYSQLFAVSMLTFPMFLLVGFAQSKKMVKKLYIYNVLGPVFQIVTVIAFSYFGGLYGLIIARIAGRAAGTLLAAGLFLNPEQT